MPRRLARQRMTLSDLEWPFHASRVISAKPELYIYILSVIAAPSTYWFVVVNCREGMDNAIMASDPEGVFDIARCR